MKHKLIKLINRCNSISFGLCGAVCLLQVCQMIRLRVMLQREEYRLSCLARGHEAKILLLHPTFT